jgi:hypothetical protein
VRDLIDGMDLDRSGNESGAEDELQWECEEHYKEHQQHREHDRLESLKAVTAEENVLPIRAAWFDKYFAQAKACATLIAVRA